MIRQTFQQAEKKLFRTLNHYIEPIAKAGIGSPGLSPVGVIVLETVGRKSGRVYSTPLVASGLADLLLVSTVRQTSQWIKNLAATPETHLWLRGEHQAVRAYVLGPGLSISPDLPKPSALVQLLLEQLTLPSKVTGSCFAVLDLREVE